MSHIKFQINYHTNYGEEIFICGSTKELGCFDESKAVRLFPQGELWQTEIEIHATEHIKYYFLLKEHGITVRREWGEHKELYVSKKNNFIVKDNWRDKPFHSYLYSSAFTESIFAHNTTKLAIKYRPESIVLNVICPFVKKNQRLVISGENIQLGNWEIEKSLPLDYIGKGMWQTTINTDGFSENTQYKFVIVDSSTKQAIYWEEGENRILCTNLNNRNNSVTVEMGLSFRNSTFLFKGTGTAIPVFSLRSNNSFGIGDFLDLKMMVDWVALTNQQLIQVLPINDTTTSRTWRDSYPYNAISCYALHPIYLGLKDYPLNNNEELSLFLQEAEELNRLPEVDYEKVFDLKLRYTKQLFEQERERVFNSKEYRAFYKKNQFWLFSYTVYCYLRDKFGTARFSDWGEFASYNEDNLKKHIRKDTEAKLTTDYYSFLQYLLDKQLRDVKNYAHEKGIVLKGDIPIGINRDSIEAWKEPHLFNMETQTGAPPDDFSIFGQNWGFPTYNWKAMEQENFNWWKNRFSKMSDYFDAYRIDHILGFFRIWEIPTHSVQGLLGHFSPALPYWKEELNMLGIHFDEDRMTKPFINDYFLSDIFGEFTEEVKENYLKQSDWQQYKLKNEFDTQRKIQFYFRDKSDEKEIKIRDGLYALCNEVLFVRDRVDQNRFHPRITAFTTNSFRFLDDGIKNAFYKLYEDFFYHRHNYFWHEQAMKKLPPLISSTSMLVCGEDLGMVPNCVPSVMNELQILSLEIQRMPKEMNVAFAKLETLPYLSVCTTSTHDMSPIRLWWEENREITQKYYNYVLHHYGEAPEKCTADLSRQIIQKHLDSSSMWVILPWQDWMAISEEYAHQNPGDERINIPANSNHYWRYRMHMSIEELSSKTQLNEEFKKMATR